MHRRVPVAVAVAIVVAALLPAALAQNYSGWGDPVRLAAPINTAGGAETNPSLSKDGLSLYFLLWPNGTVCRPPACPPEAGVYVAHRRSVDESWGTPRQLGPNVNAGGVSADYAFTGAVDYAFISGDGHRLYFHSQRLGGYGSDDMFVSRRHDKDDDFDWGVPENLGPGINTTANEHFGSVYEDEATGETFLYFASDRLGGDDIYVSKLQPDGTFGEAELVAELSSDATDRQPHVRRDGLECVLMSNREGSIHNSLDSNSYDLWFSTRASTSDPWSTPMHFDAPINTGKHDGGPSYSFDGTELYFHSVRDGNLGVSTFDIWVLRREKVLGKGSQ